MYCSQCGKPAQGKFCSNCGSQLEMPVGPQGVATVVSGDWENEVCYQTVVNLPDVRATIERQMKLAPKRMSGEEFLKISQKLLPHPVPIPLDALAPYAQAFWERMGVKTGKQRTQVIAAPVGRVLVRIVCSLARRGQAVRGVQQAQDGCVIEAVLPSDIRSLEGDLLITVRRLQKETEVAAVARIKGQIFDWGKTRRCLDDLFSDLQLDPA